MQHLFTHTNNELYALSLPTITYDVFRWRMRVAMNTALRDARRKRRVPKPTIAWQETQLIQAPPMPQAKSGQVEIINQTPISWAGDIMHTRMQNRVAELIAATPTAGHWRHALRKKGMDGKVRNGAIATSLLGLGEGGNVELSPAVINSSIGRVKAFAQGIRQSIDPAVANFQTLLVLSSCVVLLRQGTTLAEVLDVVSTFVGHHISEEQCHLALTSCRYINQLLDRLHMGGWEMRAAEALLICEQRRDMMRPRTKC